MISPIILSSMHQNLKEIERNELLETNKESKCYGLVLSEEDVKDIITSRNDTLKGYGRIELEIKVTKQLIENIYTSQFTNMDDYLETINDMQEIFYYLKNETDDKICDDEIIEILDELYEKFTGNMDNVRGEAEEFAKKFKFGEV
ncbi:MULTISPECIES: DUF6323 family protein [unclassified Clostridioides]|uniref:DUF6323 family protein n=1 Tax=unclassified Clostridioides TaxID=2635829 RepID=UPI001D12A26C|nr:hypothetical protein [Clostridioides sp. ZZV14-6150]MCC0717829.1 hypothetical protein [Clostridioides sp. ZZV14-6105]MCC0722086.1 hypothetical protein [Clostridioides sp. ZZV14-6104]MCC0727970.1 hypothetical protein [Clostridioides sp. ZZV14-6045]MCC0732538.1 hypothetical protein [Clostridioides sp. ZZV14-6048]MCC0736499.1 hypothetical protein [Clostridioides sp. ZZV14-6009]MCC0744517.1 hypothetical protein [Clostridioides sp. ZZV14-6044]MCC0750801.1 hypothetical protein [Clostridioides s